MPANPRQLEQAQQLIQSGELERARQLLSRIVQGAPNDPTANDLMRALHLALGQVQRALYFAERAHRAAPDHPGAMADYGALLAAVGRGDEAIPLIQRALSLDPMNRQAHFALAAEYFTRGRCADADEAMRRGLELFPGDHDFSMKRVAALLSLGLAREATELLTTLMFANPDDRNAAESLATIINYDPGADRKRVFQAHVNFGRLLTAADMTPVHRHAAAVRGAVGASGARLRLGILSPDLRQHSVGFFAEPIIERLDRSRFDLYIYDTARRGDEVTARMKAHGHATWRGFGSGLPTTGGPAALAAAIHADRLDVLVELSGLTAGHSLDALRLKPAPVQVTYLGFPNTTGLPAMDARIVDSLTDPAPEADALATERLVRLDTCFLCYRPPDAAPPPREPRGAGVAGIAAGDEIVFGSFNALTKINDEVLAMWAGVLARVPRSRMLIKARELMAPDVRAHLAARCARAGIDAARVEIAEPTRDLGEHFAQYHRVDIALDTFPYHGTTTTCDALWMGVPVVTRIGDRHAARVGLSLLSCIGRAGWCGNSVAEYIDIAARLAEETRGQRATGASGAAGEAVRGMGLREAMRKSPLCDAAGFVRRFERVIEGLLAG